MITALAHRAKAWLVTMNGDTGQMISGGANIALNLIGARMASPSIGAVAATETASSTTALRARILANIELSAAARQSSNVEILFAKEAQMGSPYGGIDVWEMTSLPKGSVVYGGLPGQSSFYTDATAVLNSGGSRSALGRSLQVNPDPVIGYRQKVGEFVLTRDLRIPTGRILANPQFGPGGEIQFYIRNFKTDVRLQNTIPLLRN